MRFIVLGVNSNLPTTYRTVSMLISGIDDIGLVAAGKEHFTGDCSYSASNTKRHPRVTDRCMIDAIVRCSIFSVRCCSVNRVSLPYFARCLYFGDALHSFRRN